MKLTILLLVCLSTTSCNTKPAQVGTTPPPQGGSTARLLAHDLEEKLSVPMTQGKYAGYVERMGRCPDRFDYLLNCFS